MDYIGNAVAADRLDCKINVLQAEGMGCHTFQREAFRGDLFECEFAGFETVASCALDGDKFHGDLANREIRKLRHFALDDDGSCFTLESVDAQ